MYKLRESLPTKHVIPEFSKKISGIHSSNIISINWIPDLHSVFSEMTAYPLLYIACLHLPEISGMRLIPSEKYIFMIMGFGMQSLLHSNLWHYGKMWAPYGKILFWVKDKNNLLTIRNGQTVTIGEQLSNRKLIILKKETEFYTSLSLNGIRQKILDFQKHS